MLLIPLSPVPSQIITCGLNDQTCLIKAYQKSTGLYLDLYVNDVLVIAGVICRNLKVIVRELYFGFIGDLAFIDTQGTKFPEGPTDPYYLGLGTRYQLLYIPPEDLPPGLH